MKILIKNIDIRNEYLYSDIEQLSILSIFFVIFSLTISNIEHIV